MHQHLLLLLPDHLFIPRYLPIHPIYILAVPLNTGLDQFLLPLALLNNAYIAIADFGLHFPRALDDALPEGAVLACMRVDQFRKVRFFR